VRICSRFQILGFVSGECPVPQFWIGKVLIAIYLFCYAENEFYYPNREQAKRIQQTLETLYTGVGGEYYYGDKAWEYVEEQTGIDLRAILEKLAEENARKL